MDAWPESEPGVIFLQGGVVERIVSNRDNSERTIYLVEPELISNLFDRLRQKRRVVHYNDIPRILVDAVTSAEDKRFFQHAGFDPLRIIKAMFEDVREGRKAQGASTLSMQLARNFWLGPEKTWQRKIAEALITLQIERKLTKEQIFEYYANQVDLGQRRSFAVRGFGEAAQVYFGKDVRELSVQEAALLAGMIQKPNLYNPYRHEDRALQRRNVVLGLMHENGYLTDLQYVEATKAPLKLAEGGIESTDAPYFVDLVNDELRERFADVDFQATQYRIYTTLDMKLQREAVEAVRIGMQEVDAQLAKRRKKYPEPQVALVAMDPHTGRGAGAGGGTQLRAEPVEPRAGDAAAGLVVQAVRVRGGVAHGDHGRAGDADAGQPGDRRAHDIPVRRQGLRAQQFPRGVARAGDAAGGAGALDEHSDGEIRRDGGLRNGGRTGAGRGFGEYQGHAGRGAGGLRSDAAADCQRLHHVQQRRALGRSRTRSARCGTRPASWCGTTAR